VRQEPLFAVPESGSVLDSAATQTTSRRTQRFRRRVLSSVKLFRHHKLGAVGLGVVAVVVLVGVCAPLLATHDPTAQDLSAALKAPSGAHFFGTDELGRDLFSRVLFGARVSVGLGVAIVACAVAVGMAAGVVAGFLGGWVDGVIMRLADAFLAFPKLILAMAVTAALGPSLRNTFLAVSATWWPEYARLARSVAVAERNAEFVAAARVLGVPTRRVIRRHVLPAALGPNVAKATLDIGFAIIYVAGLSFIGFGVRPPKPEWGLMVAEGQNYVNTAWWIVTIPGLAILITALGFNLLGESVRDMMDPALRADARARAHGARST
jgi:peptide/nickel transport system permease protein